MSERIAETTNLGNAFLAQEAEVMDMVQQLRAKAYAKGNLTTTPEQKVIVEKEEIVIEPVNPKVVYVPYYDPFYIYGPWWYPAYPPYYWGPPGVSLGIGISFWPGIYFGYSWGSWGYFDWPHHHVYIHAHERPRYVRHDQWHAESGRWHHSPVHRRGVAYPDKHTASKYGQYPQRHGDFRGDARGFPESREPDGEGSRPGDTRTRIDQNRRMDANSMNERSKQEQQRVERELQKREQPPRQPADQDQQNRPSSSATRLRRNGRPETSITRQGGAYPPGTGAADTATNRPGTPTSGQVERVPQIQERQMQQRTDQEGRAPEAVRGEPSRRRRETVFDLQGNDRNVRQSSERGRSSRQEGGNVRHDRGQSGGGKGPGRDAGGRNRH